MSVLHHNCSVDLNKVVHDDLGFGGSCTVCGKYMLLPFNSREEMYQALGIDDEEEFEDDEETEND